MRLWKKIISATKLLKRSQRDYKALFELNIFDAAYFFSFFTDDVSRVGDPLITYFMHWRTNFDGMREVRRSWRQLPDPHPLFDTSFYLQRYFPKGLRRNPFAHYLLKGWRKGYWPSPYFDPERYRENSGWDKSQGNPLIHYCRSGGSRNTSPSPFFDVDWYIDRTSVLVPAKSWIIRHYKMYGAVDGVKSPIPVFDPVYYLGQVDDPVGAGRDPLAHYVTNDPIGQLRPCELFDPIYYRQTAIPLRDPAHPLVHYLEKGVYNQHYISLKIEELPRKPVVSIIVPVYNTNRHFLNNCIRSVLYQAYPHWELCLVDDGSSDPQIREILTSWSGRDARIKTVFHEYNTGISNATNTGTSIATGEYLGFLDHDDELTPDCLYRVVETINNTGALVLYSDEDLVGNDSSRLGVFYKPDFNRELLFSHNYITHFLVVQSAFFHRIGCLDPALDGAQDFDLVLRCDEHTDTIVHIPRVLYHWRASDTSTSIHHDDKPYAHKAGKKALAASLQRRRSAVAVLDGELNFHYRLKYCRPEEEPSVAILVWCADEDVDIGHLKATLVAPGECGLCEIVPVFAGRQTQLGADPKKAERLHQAILASRHDYIAILGSGALAISDGWLKELVGPILAGPDCDIGIVCGLTRFDNGDGHSYAVPDISDLSGGYFAEALCSMSRHLNGLHNFQAMRCCDWNISMFNRSLYLRIGGFDYQRFPVELAMHDFSFTVAETGKKILYVPSAFVIPETRTGLTPAPGQPSDLDEKRRFQMKWREVLRRPDPYYNIGRLMEQGIDGECFMAWLVGDVE